MRRGKYDIHYTLVIPYYNDEYFLRNLFEGIHTITKRYPPDTIIVVDDGSDETAKYVCNYYQSETIPIRMIEQEHRGPFYAESRGLQEVTTPLAMVAHADLSLTGKYPSTIERPLYRDTMSVLICYLHQVKHACAVGCYTLAIERPRRIFGGPRSMANDGLVYSYAREFHIEPVLLNRFDDWVEVYSIDNYLFALRMDAYRAVGGYDEKFAPYGFYHDDFFARARAAGYRTYLTQDVLAFHPRLKEKDERSYSRVNTEQYIAKALQFREYYKGSLLWKPESLERNEISVHEFGYNMPPI